MGAFLMVFWSDRYQTADILWHYFIHTYYRHTQLHKLVAHKYNTVIRKCAILHLPCFSHAIGVIPQYVFGIPSLHAGWTMDLFVSTCNVHVVNTFYWEYVDILHLSPHQVKVKIIKFKFLQCISASWLYFIRLTVQSTVNALWSQHYLSKQGTYFLDLSFEVIKISSLFTTPSLNRPSSAVPISSSFK